jgi:hypothetical protein
LHLCYFFIDRETETGYIVRVVRDKKPTTNEGDQMEYKHLKEISEIHARISNDPYGIPVSLYPKAWDAEFRSVYGFSIREYVLHVKKHGSAN